MDKSAFDAITLSVIESFISTRQEEHVSLEFKTAGNDLSSGGDKRNYAEMLSGFANSAGGVIVWGVATEKDPVSGLDVAARDAPFENAPRFRARLEELAPHVVAPEVTGVLHREVLRSSTSGFVVTFVPSADGPPHMALAGHERYFKRAGDKFYRMEHFDVAAMFGRHQQAVLTLSYAVENVGSDPDGRYMRICLSLANTGRAPATAPYVYFEGSDGRARPEQRGLSQPARAAEGLMRMVALTRTAPGQVGLYGFLGLRDLVLPPGPTVDVGAVFVAFPREGAAGIKNIRCRFGAENAIMAEQTIVLDGDALSGAG